MFCKKCGRKLPVNATNCSECGAAAEQAEYCGGFWGLVGEKKTPAVIPVPAEPKKQTNIPPEENNRAEIPAAHKADTPKKPVFLYSVCLVLILLLLIQTVGYISTSSKLRVLQKKYDALHLHSQELQENNSSIVEQLESIEEILDSAIESMKQTEADTDNSETLEETVPDSTEAEATESTEVSGSEPTTTEGAEEIE